MLRNIVNARPGVKSQGSAEHMMFLFPTIIRFSVYRVSALPSIFWLFLTEKTKRLKNGNRETNKYVKTNPSGVLNV